MRKQLALIVLSVCSPMILVATAIDLAALEWIAAVLVPVLPVVLIAAASPEPSARSLCLLGLLLSGSWLGLLGLSATRDLAQPGVGEVGVVLALMLGGLGVGPLLLVAWLHARSFSTRGLAPDDLARLRGRRR
jgi:hypothetical protein